MSETKRVTITTIASSSVSSTLMTGGASSTSLRFGGDFVPPPDKVSLIVTEGGGKSSNKNLRLNVELFQTDSNKYPEFDFAKLLHLEKKKLKKRIKKTNGFSDPFEENDDDVARIAKQLEIKYGSAYSGGGGRGKNKRDDVDIGMGYDETDSFIDNTEAYDEIIPDEVETIEGGFYINCGALEFKKLHTESMTTKTDEIIKMPNRPKKRILSSSSEESSSSDDEDDDDDDEDESDEDEEGDGEEDGGTGGETSAETNRSKSSSNTIIKKSKKPSMNTVPGNATKNKAENGNVLAKKKTKNLGGGFSAGSSSNSPKPATDDMATDSERERSVKKITSVKDMLKAQRDNYLKSRSSDVTRSSNGDSKEKSSEDEEDDDDDDSSSSDESEENDESNVGNSDSNQSKDVKDKKTASSNEESQGNEKLRSYDTKLPEMDSEVLASVIEFREGAKSKNLIGKKFQFDDHLSESFLKIDDSLLCIDKSERNMVFAHFEYHLALPKYYFLRKAKQLRIKEEKLKSKKSFSKLHKAVTEVMPAVIASYDIELRRCTELQASNANSDQQPPKMPKKKFPWNTNLRNLLYEVYQVRWTSYPVLGTRKETLEDFITSYMSKKVVEIWPKGWMRYDELQKEIEKKKTAAKKAKEKGKSQIIATAAAISAQNVPGISPAINTLQNSPQAMMGNFSKQIEELSTRSNDNSETDSIASSHTSLGLKRKNVDGTAGAKQGKSKAAKINGEQKKAKNINNIQVTDSTISIKKADHSISHIITPISATAIVSSTLGPTVSSSIFSSTVAAVSQPLKHSSNTHVIDLDYYNNTSEILQTTKQIQQAVSGGSAAYSQFSVSNDHPSLSNTAKPPLLRRESSGDSEIEIVGVFPAKAPTKKQKTHSRSTTPNTYQAVSDKTNNHSNNRNSKKGTNSTTGAINLIGIDLNKNTNPVIDLRDDIKVKPIRTSNAHTSTLQAVVSSSSVPSNTTHQ